MILLIIDANSLIHRSFHALPPLTDSDGNQIGALYGLSSMLIKILQDLKPDYIAAAFDRPEETFRKKEFREYKINRATAPVELIDQLKKARNIFSIFNVKTFDSVGFEADDVIATLCMKFKNEESLNKIIVLTGDHDSLQLVDKGKIFSMIPKKGISEFKEYGYDDVIERTGVSPELIPDYKGLVGDSSDNIPGVAGIGPKSAATIINTYGTLEDFYTLSPSPKNSSVKKVLEARDIALLSKYLATVRYDVPIDSVELSDLSIKDMNISKLAEDLEKIGFFNLSERIRKQGLQASK